MTIPLLFLVFVAIELYQGNQGNGNNFNVVTELVL
jgi:hypothetical protein